MSSAYSTQKQEQHHPSRDGEPTLLNGRRFHPEHMYRKDQMDLIECYHKTFDCVLAACPGTSEPCERCGELEAHSDVFVVAIDGSCKGNGTMVTRSSIGVFFHYRSDHNITRAMPSTVDTSQKAELTAGIIALKTLLQIKKQGTAISMVIIKSDSEYLVKGISEWIGKWRQTGWKTSRGTEVNNKSFFEKLEAGVERLNKRGVKVLFWHVPREANWQAHELAERAHEDGEC